LDFKLVFNWILNSCNSSFWASPKRLKAAFGGQPDLLTCMPARPPDVYASPPIPPKAEGVPLEKTNHVVGTTDPFVKIGAYIRFPYTYTSFSLSFFQKDKKKSESESEKEK
jgi:hypothetical protein